MSQPETDFSGAVAPLAGLRVIDAATFIAAPFCATLLSEFGAEVIKVEEPRQGDSLRRLAEQYQGEGLWWLQESRNKKTVTCDLRRPEGQDLFRRLIAKADVVVENFRPGTMEGWGLGYEDLASVNPGLIMLRISGYGQTGPAASKPGFGRIAQAFAGLTFLAGYPDRPPVVPGSATIADYVAGLFGAFSVLVAKEHRDRSGEGQEIDVSLYEGMFRLLDTLAIVYDKLGIVRQRSAFDAPHAAPHSHYPTRDGNWVAVACTNDKIYARFCEAMGAPELVTDPRFLTNADRVAHRAEIDRLVGIFTASMDLKELVALLDAHEIPVSPINSIVDIFDDPQYQARQTMITIEDERVGRLRMPGIVPRMSKTPGSIMHAGRPLGADNEAVYVKLLGLTSAEISDLSRKGVI
jgi:succinyl-CoA:(S)-malate CoA-transferase subunit B